MSEHTKGPWHVVLSDNGTPFIQHEGGADWTDIDDRSCRICHMPAEIVEEFNSLNNARLISSAPDLLLALEMSPAMLHTLPEGGECRCSQCEFVRLRDSAIKKARGEK